MHYEAKSFEIPTLEGISEKTIKEHLGLYEGYVKNTNKIAQLVEEADKHDTYALKEAKRRLAFEFDGMRNHEYYFGLLARGASDPNEESALYEAISQEFGSFTKWLEGFKGRVAKTRGVGWAILGYDTHTDQLLNYWVDEQHLGHLTGVQPIVALDMWEHSYAMDYAPSEKSEYIEAFFRNISWSQAEEWFEEVKTS